MSKSGHLSVILKCPGQPFAPHLYFTVYPLVFSVPTQIPACGSPAPGFSELASVIRSQLLKLPFTPVLWASKSQCAVSSERVASYSYLALTRLKCLLLPRQYSRCSTPYIMQKLRTGSTIDQATNTDFTLSVFKGSSLAAHNKLRYLIA